MEKFFHRENFLNVCSLNCSLARIFGYFHFEVGRKKLLKCEKFLRFFLYVVFGFLVSQKSANVTIGTFNSGILSIGITFLIKLTIFMSTVFRVFNFLVRNFHSKIVKDFHKIDEKLKEIGVEIDHGFI